MADLLTHDKFVFVCFYSNATIVIRNTVEKWTQDFIFEAHRTLLRREKETEGSCEDNAAAAGIQSLSSYAIGSRFLG